MSYGVLSNRRRRDLLLAAGSAVGGALLGGGAVRAFASDNRSGTREATARTLLGKVVAEPPPSGVAVSVDIPGIGVQQLPYTAPYVPVVGDEVAISELAGGTNVTRVVIAGQSGRSGNLVVNGDFHAVPPLTSRLLPYMWGHHRAAGRNTEALAMISPTAHKPVAVLSSGAKLEASGDNVLYSAAFPVKPGDVIKGDASMNVDLVQPCRVDVDLRIGWFADIAATYPNVLPQNGQKVLYARSFEVDGEQLFEGSGTAPAGAAAARLAVRARHQVAGEGGQYTLFIGHVYGQR